MHLVTGVIIAALAGKAKQNKVLQGLPMFKTGPIRIAHALPGRIRFIIPTLRENHETMKPGMELLEKSKGIDSVNYNPISGSLTVRFNQELVPPSLLFSIIARLFELEHELDKPVTSEIVRQTKELGGSLNKMVYDETHGMVDLRTIAIGALILLGSRKLLLEKSATLPTGLTLLWWAFNLLSKSEGGKG